MYAIDRNCNDTYSKLRPYGCARGFFLHLLCARMWYQRLLTHAKRNDKQERAKTSSRDASSIFKLTQLWTAPGEASDINEIQWNLNVLTNKHRAQRHLDYDLALFFGQRSKMLLCEDEADIVHPINDTEVHLAKVWLKHSSARHRSAMTLLQNVRDHV